ncbi:MAG: 1,4-alpha-glucan branching protein GlgB [Clostridia bacterium]|nr:1,4-alpha-glucan branching protein GlgB [Lachnospiraceae bacterium]NCB99648.1 1,4-alpha-glucan branching protein GlgB [Clostridia bacterium]NCD01852.1 1,4-alpha-glucan branching protein GlgB [Clostridia bacterium]
MEHRITGFDNYLFKLGRHYEIYQKLGAHIAEEDGETGTYFAVWAPNAASVSVVGDFNGWNMEKNPMKPVEDSGIYDVFVPGVGKGELYKYVIETQQGERFYKADPYGNLCQVRPENASVVTNIREYHWADEDWQARKTEVHETNQPMAVYEVHLGSWKKSFDGENNGFLGYRRLAKELAEYANYMGYTHVELMGIAEHPLDASWGYQVTGYYAPTSRYGTPEDFMFFVDYMHSQGIGVILDWVPAHFPKDEHGLARFDGTPLYEHPDPKKGEHPDWGTYVFNYTRPEISNFLVANALFWLEQFHVDGLRVDAVASMLYLDYGRQEGQWTPNDEGGRENKEAVEFLKHLNSIIHHRCPGVMMIAEESTAWPKVTETAEKGGLGFTYKWNMGWMNDFLEYMKIDPYFRKFDHNKLTFSFTYAYSEKYILVLSHDEVVHMKGSMIGKMPGEPEEKFGNLRAAYGFMMAHPGKKLLFMGQDFAQIREWSEERSIDWFLLDNETAHRQLNNYYRDLLHFYREQRALYELDDNKQGFMWINGGDTERNMITFCRMTKNGKNCLLFHFNFSPVVYEGFRSGVPYPGIYTEVFNNSREEYGGMNMLNEKPIMAEPVKWDFQKHSIQYDLPAFGMVVFAFDCKPAQSKQPGRTSGNKSYGKQSVGKKGKTRGKGVPSRKTPVKNKG